MLALMPRSLLHTGKHARPSNIALIWKQERKMGVWDSIKKVAAKAKCGIGFHGGTFATPEGMPQCHLEKICPDCGEHIVEKRHAYALDWNNAPFDPQTPTKCTRHQNCIHCGEIQQKEVHEAYRKERKGCELLLVCTRCGDVESEGYEHEYEKLGINAKCQVVSKCRNCGDTKTEGYAHAFVREGVEGEKILVRCTNCGFKDKVDYL